MAIDLDHLPLDDEPTYELFRSGKTACVFQFDSSGMRDLLRRAKPRVFRRPRGPQRPLPPRGARRGHRRGLRAAAQRHQPRDVPASRARADPRRDARHPGVPGAGHADRPARRRLLARRGGPAAQGHRQEEARDHAGRGREVHPQVGGARHAEEEGAGALVADRAVRPVRIQQVPRRGLRPRGLQDGVPEGALSGRLLRGQPLRRDRLDRRDREGPRRLPGVRDRGPAAGHQRVAERASRPPARRSASASRPSRASGKRRPGPSSKSGGSVRSPRSPTSSSGWTRAS